MNDLRISSFNFQAAVGTGTDAITSGNLAALASQPAMLFGLSANFEAVGTPTPAAGTGFTSIGTGWDFEATTPLTMRSEHKRVTVTTADDATFTTAEAAGDYITCAVSRALAFRSC